MNESDRKILTNQLGECWHIQQDDSILCRCGEPLPHNRTFTTAQDMVDLSNELGRCGQWREFFGYCFKPFIDSNPLKAAPSDMCLWLITNPTRTCGLIAEYLLR